MRYQTWKHFLNSKIHRMRNKFTNWFDLNSPLASIYNRAKCKSTRAGLRQFHKQNFSKTPYLYTKPTTKKAQSNSSLNVMVSSSEIETSTDKINELMELSHQHDILRAEQIQLKKQIKKRITVLIKAMYRHRRGMKKLQELEQLISEYIEEIQAPVTSDCTIGSVERYASKAGTVQVEQASSNQLIRLRIERNVGGYDKSSDFYYDFMPLLVRRYASIRKLARRWMEKAHVKTRRNSPLDIYSAVSLQRRSSLERMVKPALTDTFAAQGVRKPQPKVKELNTDEQIERDMQEMKSQAALDERKRITSSLQSLISGEDVRVSAESKLKEGSSKGVKGKESATSDIDKVGSSQRVGKRKRRKRRSSRKSVQSVTSDAPRKGQKGRSRKKTSRRSRKSIDSADQDTSVRRRSQSRRKVKKRPSKLSKRSRRSSSQKSADAIDVAERERRENVSDSVGKKSKRSSKTEKSLETILVGIDKEVVIDKKPKRKSAQSVTSEHISGETVGRKQKAKGMEVKSSFHDEYSALEQYWGVSLREDYTLKRLIKLNSLLDDLIVEEEQKPVPKRMLASRKMSTKPSKRELSDLQKLLILFKECQECQKKQQHENMQINESNYAAQSQKEYYNTIKNAAGMPDCLPDESDYSFACSCNSFV